MANANSHSSMLTVDLLQIAVHLRKSLASLSAMFSAIVYSMYLLNLPLLKNYLAALCRSIALTSSKSISLKISISFCFWGAFSASNAFSYGTMLPRNLLSVESLHSCFHAVVSWFEPSLIPGCGGMSTHHKEQHNLEVHPLAGDVQWCVPLIIADIVGG